MAPWRIARFFGTGSYLNGGAVSDRWVGRARFGLSAGEGRVRVWVGCRAARSVLDKRFGSPVLGLRTLSLPHPPVRGCSVWPLGAVSVSPKGGSEVRSLPRPGLRRARRFAS